MKYLVALLAIGILIMGTSIGCYAISLEELTNNLITSNPRNSDGISSPKTLIQSFCTTVLSIDNVSSTNGYYDPKQSFFIAGLCNELTPSRTMSNFVGTDKFLKISKRSERGTSCDSSKDMTRCDIGKDTTRLYSNIMNELGNMKLAHLYGIHTLQGDIKDQVNARSTTYMNTKLCEEPCQYPQTYALLRSTFEQARNLAKNTTFMNYQNISESGPSTCKPGESDFNMAWCGLVTGGNMIYFHNLVYNELIWYELFNTYYIQMLAIDTATSEFNRDVLSSLKQQSDSIQSIQQYITKTKQATSIMLQMMSSIQNTFPIHVSLLVYYESVDQFRRSFAKIYTPLHQLYYKLRNVQEKS